MDGLIFVEESMWYLKSNRIEIVRISKQYTDFLRNNVESKIPKEHVEENEFSRPFIGIFVSNGQHDYVIPLTSPKEKHKKMKNGIDFHKIDGGTYGAINFNNMFPIINHPSIIEVIDTSITNDKSQKEIQYIKLLRNQLTWLNISKNKTTILRKAEILYSKYISNTLSQNIKSRCCNFPKLENEYKNFHIIKSI